VNNCIDLLFIIIGGLYSCFFQDIPEPFPTGHFTIAPSKLEFYRTYLFFASSLVRQTSFQRQDCLTVVEEEKLLFRSFSSFNKIYTRPNGKEQHAKYLMLLDLPVLRVLTVA
jgi:hypothetical protein